MSILYMVATPIGNLGDITVRALEILKTVDVIACEDTRRTQKLLARYEIRNRLIACHAHNEQQSARGIVKLLDEGNTLAYVSEAGTPGISDPGSRLVSEVRLRGHEVIPIPGPAALASLVSVAGYTGKSILFEGFLSPKAGRRATRLKELLLRNEAFVLYESPFRIVKVLASLSELAPDRRVLVGREMTKSFEEYVEGSATEVYDNFASRPVLKGECTMLISPTEKGANIDDKPS